MDLTTLTDDELTAHRDAVLNELERRQRLASVPAQIAAMASAFIADGGDRAALVDALPTA